MVEYPKNDFTQMIERVAAGNRSGMRGGGLASAEPLPTVRSAELGTTVPDSAPTDPPPLTAEERAELDARALELGIVDERLGNASAPGEAPPTYGSLEEALAAGAPVNAPPVPEDRATPASALPRPDRVSAREFIGRPQRIVQVPRLPDFGKIEGIDLVTNRVIVDGMDFPISDDEAKDFRQFVIEKVRAVVMEALDKAVGILTSATTPEDTNGGTTGTPGATAPVQREHQGSGEESSQ